MQIKQKRIYVEHEETIRLAKASLLFLSPLQVEKRNIFFKGGGLPN